jgi:hypothetical protein
VRRQEPVDVGLPARRPLDIALSNNPRAFRKDIGDLFVGGALLQKPRRQRVSESVRVGVQQSRDALNLQECSWLCIRKSCVSER